MDQIKKRILVISEVGCPPPHRGNRVRMTALIREIHKLGYQVDFAGVDMDAGEREATRQYVDRWIWDFVSKPTNSKRNFYDRILGKWQRAVRHFGFSDQGIDQRFYEPWLAEARDLQKRENYSCVLVAYAFHSKFLEAFPEPCLRVLDTHDVFAGRKHKLAEHGVHDQWFSTTRAGERRALLRANRVIAIQNEEAKYFHQLIGGRRDIYTIGHFLDENEEVFSQPSALLRIGFIGSSNSLNRQGLGWFFDHVWPIIQMENPKVEIQIAGEISSYIPATPQTILLGQISKLNNFYQNCAIVINPIQTGTGLKIKTIEALAFGKPVVTTSCGAEGISGFIGAGLIIQNSPQGFAEAVLDFMADASKAKSGCKAAFSLVREINARNRENIKKLLNGLQDIDSCNVRSYEKCE